jgi:hypothetical protein
LSDVKLSGLDDQTLLDVLLNDVLRLDLVFHVKDLNQVFEEADATATG